MSDHVILVDGFDNELGTMEKLEAHQKGVLHRAFSAFIFNSRDELLIHQRAENKYHSAGLWTNTCCSHPKPGEALGDAVHRRLQEEMGFDCAVREAFSFVYHAEMENDLVEHEFDHVFVGQYDGAIDVNPDEVADWRYVSLPDVRRDVEQHPERYTAWFRKAIARVHDYMLNNARSQARFKVA